MKSHRILFPIDVAKCPLDVLPLLNKLAGRSDATVILLHVVNLNILAPDNRIYLEHCRNASRILDRLAKNFVNPLVDVRTRVRVGNPFEEIVCEAQEQQVQMILLPTFPSSVWRRLLAPLARRVAERLAVDAPCPVFSLRSKTAVNCEDLFGADQPVPNSARNDPKQQRPFTASLPVLQNN